MSTERKTVVEMLGEFTREVSVLLLVFGFLDRILRGDLTVVWSLKIMTACIVSLSVGMLAERSR